MRPAAEPDDSALSRVKHYVPERWNAVPRLRRVTPKSPCEVAMRDKVLAPQVERWFMESESRELCLAVGDGRFAVFRREKAVVGGVECVLVKDAVRGTVFRGRPVQA